MEIKSIKNKTGTAERAVIVSRAKKKKELAQNTDKSKVSIPCFLGQIELEGVVLWGG